MADKFTSSQQENLLSLIAFSEQHSKLVLDLVDTQYFTSDYRIIAERCAEYVNKYERPPGREHLFDLLSDIVEDKQNRNRNAYIRIVQQLDELQKDVNVKYVIDQANSFIRKQTLTNALMKSAELLQSGQLDTMDQVEQMWSGLLRADRAGFSAGTRVTDYERILEYLSAQYKEFDTGIPAFDKYSIVPYRGAAMLFLASTGMGKTWWLTHLGKRALLMRKKILHVSLEMSEEEVGSRYLQSLFSIGKRFEARKIIELGKDNYDRLESMSVEEVTPELSFGSKSIYDDLRVRMTTMGSRLDNLLIKRFPPRYLTGDLFRAYLDTLERTENFIPDLVLLDYLGITKTDSRDHRISLGRNFEDFRAVAVERNHALATAHQIARRGAGAKFVDVTDIAEDWSLVGTADRAIVYSQTAQENRLGLARLFAAKARSDADKFGVLITQSYAMGQFLLDSVNLNDRYWDALSDAAEEAGIGEDDDDEEEEDDDE